MPKTVKEAIDDIKKKQEKAMWEILFMVEADAKQLCPVRTGTLKRSITSAVETQNNKVIGAVGSNVEYAYWAERHTPYLEPAVDKNLENIRRKIKEVMNG